MPTLTAATAAILLAASCWLSPVSGQLDEVALIIGGFWRPLGPDDQILDSVEIFGCYDDQSVILPEFPRNAYLPGATYLEDEEMVKVSTSDQKMI